MATKDHSLCTVYPLHLLREKSATIIVRLFSVAM